MLVPYRGYSGSFPTLSATRLLQGDAEEGALDVLEGAVVLIGTSALGLADLRTTPFQTSFPGVEVHANAVDTILNAYWQQSNAPDDARSPFRSEEHTSELQSRGHLVCRLLLEKKNTLFIYFVSSI